MEQVDGREGNRLATPFLSHEDGCPEPEVPDTSKQKQSYTCVPDLTRSAIKWVSPIQY